ncbi:MAG: dTDP-4-dehydrorhamnose 3,5-epimerase [Candidatus Marinimicrobia bacterium]|jgi:dTDP-4-dehydrorhamnose 3,5-epimerase|nr:dTDP-4-dehydrorhamnose 3,5-epimerase [Candidatus Neomarinimicrobiota bacterium]MDP6610921.1 dTDP-4-dehydrorhamnose 3,5-epimerase [Candidatus Neomarinimicrobiota bacterium]|tara:strand:+ start:25286 stop:25849 length:564 start_codon:yes stop_codon:yes gene_type:complete
MKVKKASITGVIIIRPDVHQDKRGYFFESFKNSDFEVHGLPTHFVQDNQAKSSRGVLRGLHYQLNHAQGKLVWVSAGSVLDVAVDIRKGSPTFGQYESAVLDDKTHTRFYIPPGFAHGYYVLSESATFQYKCTDLYYPEDEYGIHWNDPEIGIEWGIGDKLVSEKDAVLPRLDEMDLNFLPQYRKNN